MNAAPQNVTSEVVSTAHHVVSDGDDVVSIGHGGGVPRIPRVVSGRHDRWCLGELLTAQWNCPVELPSEGRGVRLAPKASNPESCDIRVTPSPVHTSSCVQMCVVHRVKTPFDAHSPRALACASRGLGWPKAVGQKAGQIANSSANMPIGHWLTKPDVGVR